MDEHLKARLASQMSRGEIILFTGAGFSLGAVSVNGVPVPTVSALREMLWPLAFPTVPYEANSSLGDIYDCAVQTAGNRSGELLKSVLLTDPEKLPGWYRVWFSMPWLRMYTLNVDDIEQSAQRIFTLPRRIESISALKDAFPGSSRDLACIHLNGRVCDYPEMTFSTRNYGERTASPDPWYHHLVADLAGRPAIFVGTELDEPPLWQQIELRRRRIRGDYELRPGSYLVTPRISLARRSMLQTFNIQLVEMNAEQFAEQILSPLGAEKEAGLRQLTRSEGPGSRTLQRVAELRNQKSDMPGDFLLGREPAWSDIVDAIAVQRTFEPILKKSIDDSGTHLAVLTGTAGSGKSATLMRLALQFQAEGKDAVWFDPRTDLTISAIRREVSNSKAQVVLADDIDSFGSGAGPLIASLVAQCPDTLFVVSLRTTRFDDLGVGDYVNRLNPLVFSIPHLDDADIELLLDALTRASRLGELKGMSRTRQIEIFRRAAGRQLLVAMIRATSGKEFEEKVDSECHDLPAELGLIYAVLALATSLRTPLTQEEVLLAINDPSNEALNRIRRLKNQRLIVSNDGSHLQLRHRVIADRALEYYRRGGMLPRPLEGLLWAMATKVGPSSPRYSRERRILIQLMNHEFMVHITQDREIPRRAYTSIEELLNWDYHYFLQRGSFEVEAGDVNLAKNFLDQARSLAPDDHMVQTEWAYMELKRASVNASSAWAKDRVKEAIVELIDAIDRRGRTDSYPYHVLGSQVLRWVRSAPLSPEEKARELSRALALVQEGAKLHPEERALLGIEDALRREYLSLAVVDGN